MLIKKLIKYFKRPKCKRKYNCVECHNVDWNIYHDDSSHALTHPCFKCKINAR